MKNCLVGFILLHNLIFMQNLCFPAIAIFSWIHLITILKPGEDKAMHYNADGTVTDKGAYKTLILLI